LPACLSAVSDWNFKLSKALHTLFFCFYPSFHPSDPQTKSCGALQRSTYWPMWNVVVVCIFICRLLLLIRRESELFKSTACVRVCVCRRTWGWTWCGHRSGSHLISTIAHLNARSFKVANAIKEDLSCTIGFIFLSFIIRTHSSAYLMKRAIGF
jgi:hypothetical protein